MKNISKRLQKFVDIARIVPYNNEELQQLLPLLRAADFDEAERTWTVQEFKSDIDYGLIQSTIEDFIKYKCYATDWGARGLNLMEFFLLYFRRVFIFLTRVDKKDVPIYIGTHKHYLKPFVEWRLRIDK
jgi:hypothetical protein